MVRRALLATATLLLPVLVIHAQISQPPDTGAPVGSPHVYKTVAGQDVHVYTQPADPSSFPGKRPILVTIHGGGFTGGLPEGLNRQAQWFLKRGFASVEVEYRLIGKGAKGIDDQIRDVRAAVRWTKAHASGFSGDPSRVVFLGGSAGGYLIEANILLDGPDDPDQNLSVSTLPMAVVLFNPVLNGSPGSPMEKLLGDRWKDLSPLARVTNKQPPTLILSGDADVTVGVKDIVEFERLLKAAGVRSELDLYPHQIHAFFNHEPYTTATLLVADMFLTSLHLTSGPTPTIANPLAPDMLPTVTR